MFDVCSHIVIKEVKRYWPASAAACACLLIGTLCPLKLLFYDKFDLKRASASTATGLFLNVASLGIIKYVICRPTVENTTGQLDLMVYNINEAIKQIKKK